ncbi:cysteine-rich Secretory family protein [Ceratobasidium sp. AG-Ba]|nr:cysteine-rich Secretory family protein [Ceratobasidium sp. AG-Ba]QRW09460.1 cysteine-rich Secretory family protein [Ceratobasidium sp. AG-Ba]
MVQVSPVVTLLATITVVSAHWRDAHSINTTEVHMTGTHLLGRATTQQQYLDAHNAERAAHGAAALTWDAGLAASAQSWATQCKFQHNSAGQNLAAGTGNPSIATEIGWWNAEISDYNPSNPQPSHWTQVVWKSTTKLGCYMATCAPGTIFDASYGSASYVVCNYSPAGNVIGQFPQNVQK